MISINHNLVYRVHENNKCYFTISTPKTNAGCRTIPMLPEVRKALEDERCRQQKTGKTCQTVVDGYKGFIFFNRYGNAYQPAAINRQIDRVVLAYNEEETKAAEKEMRMPVLLPDFSCHQLRHTFCTRMCENETNIKVVQGYYGAHRYSYNAGNLCRSARRIERASSREFGWKDRSLLTPILTPKSSKTIISYVKIRESKRMI